MTRDEMIEQLATIEHERWADWQKHLHSKGERYTPEGENLASPHLLLDGMYVDALEYLTQLPYAQLTEEQKQSDREQVMRYWPFVVEFVDQWIRNNIDPSCDAWMDQMGTREVNRVLREARES